MSQRFVRRLRLDLFTKLRPDRRFSPCHLVASREVHTHSSNDYQKRVLQLEQHASKDAWYPRLKDAGPHKRLSLERFEKQHQGISKGEVEHKQVVSVVGRIKSIRSAGSKLIFATIEQDEHDLQIVLREAETSPSVAFGDLAFFSSIARKGDTFSFLGHPHRTIRGQLSLLAIEKPTLCSPSLHQIPEIVLDAETLSTRRHVRMLIDPEARRVLRLRHTIERAVDTFLSERGFTKVVTPILQAGAGGAIARPFETQATEFVDRKLHLRIAPELWLKRLILGGMDKVFEIGAVFRNEGVDATHNPEFSICEFYAAHTTLNELIMWTEQLLLDLSRATGTLDKDFSAPFQRLEFIPTIERKLGQSLPKLDSNDAVSELQEVFRAHRVTVPAHPSLPRLLDALAAHYIEPDCDRPTFITHHPVAMSPLSKHFICPATQQCVSARAELFVAGREIANMYEEQNSPFAQKVAFIQQLAYRDIDGEGDGTAVIDRAYLEALEWGLPPTGGWGCGVDRLVMLFSGQKRIADVLSFGTLRNVVGTTSQSGL